MAWQTEGRDLTHRSTPGRRCQADRSEKRREKTPLIPQMESLRGTLVTLLVTLQSQPGTRKEGRGVRVLMFSDDTYFIKKAKFQMLR